MLNFKKYWNSNFEYFKNKIHNNKDNKEILLEIGEKVNLLKNKDMVNPIHYKLLISQIGECLINAKFQTHFNVVNLRGIDNE